MKILVMGPFNSGKSTFVSKVSEGSSISIDRAGTTVALDYAVAEVFSMSVFLFGTPGLKRFDMVRRVLSTGADGVLFLIDSTKPYANESQALFAEIKNTLPNVPIIIAANKQDIPSALPPEEAARLAGFSKEDYFIIGTSATTGKGIERALKVLTLAILRRMLPVLRVILEEGGNPNSLEKISQKLNVPLQKARLMLRWLEWRRVLSADWYAQTFELKPFAKQATEILLEIERLREERTPPAVTF
ncbi:MAG: ATP/GTP-binding protein [Candidatus Wukongarchaeota archaeon]|nr:GTP-binding protein [Candidatus Wukongarchaeota archaeon]